MGERRPALARQPMGLPNSPPSVGLGNPQQAGSGMVAERHTVAGVVVVVLGGLAGLAAWSHAGYGARTLLPQPARTARVTTSPARPTLAAAFFEPIEQRELVAEKATSSVWAGVTNAPPFGNDSVAQPASSALQAPRPGQTLPSVAMPGKRSLTLWPTASSAPALPTVRAVPPSNELAQHNTGRVVRASSHALAETSAPANTLPVSWSVSPSRAEDKENAPGPPAVREAEQPRAVIRAIHPTRRPSPQPPATPTGNPLDAPPKLAQYIAQPAENLLPQQISVVEEGPAWTGETGPIVGKTDSSAKAGHGGKSLFTLKLLHRGDNLATLGNGETGNTCGLRGKRGCSSCGGSGRAPCYPGTKRCDCLETHDSYFGRFVGDLYHCICCPDPCYDPKWLPLADAAYFVEAARPVTQSRLRWTYNMNMMYPDRAEFFWPRADGKGKGPSPVAPASGEASVDVSELTLYNEAATGNLGIFVELPYRTQQPEFAGHAAGFSDMNLGTKSLLFDCELLQVAFQFRTYLPTGNFRKGLGSGHVSLEPSLLIGLKLADDWYYQGQFSEWIPIAGDGDFAGAVFHFHNSVNTALYRWNRDLQLLGSAEWSGWAFQDGLYTDPVSGPKKASGLVYMSAGPGVRLVVCDKLDFGAGTHFSFGTAHWGDVIYRTEFRWRY